MCCCCRTEKWDRDQAWRRLKSLVIEDHGPLFWCLLCSVKILRLAPSLGEVFCQPRRSPAHERRHDQQKCSRKKDYPCDLDLSDFAKGTPGTHKLDMNRLDASHTLDVMFAIAMCVAFWLVPTPLAGPSLLLRGVFWVLVALAAWRIGTIVVDAVAMLWFDDLIDLYYRKDPRVQSFRRLSMHVVLQIVEVVLLFACIYAVTSSSRPFGDFLFGSFESGLTLNYEPYLNRIVWVAEVATLILLIVLVLAVAAGERYARKEVARNPGVGWSKPRELSHPFKEPGY